MFPMVLNNGYVVWDVNDLKNTLASVGLPDEFFSPYEADAEEQEKEAILSEEIDSLMIDMDHMRDTAFEFATAVEEVKNCLWEKKGTKDKLAGQLSEIIHTFYNNF